MQIEKIGTVYSCFKEKFGTPRQGSVVEHSRGYIEIDKKWEPQQSLKGLEAFSHIWVLFYFHSNTNLSFKPVIRPPRLEKERLGLFATRSPLRPNPIGLSLVKLDRIEGVKVYISGLDIIEGTPVLDIKPYIHSYDSVENSRDGWLEQLRSDKLEVEFSKEAEEVIQRHPYPNLRQTLCEILCNDIRNRSDKRPQNSEKHLGFYFADLNVIFQVHQQSVLVTKIELATNFTRSNCQPD